MLVLRCIHCTVWTFVFSSIDSRSAVTKVFIIINVLTWQPRRLSDKTWRLKIINGSITLPACKRLVGKHNKNKWQTRWERSSTGRATYALIPSVGCNIRFPKVISKAVSYIRLLLGDSALNDRQFCMGLNDTRVCECGQDIEDVDHYFFKCPKYESIRRVLLQSVQDILSDDVHCHSRSLTVSLLSPWLCQHVGPESYCSFPFTYMKLWKIKKQEFSDDLSRANYHSVAKDIIMFSLFSGTWTLQHLQKEIATYRHWSVSLWRYPDDVPHCRILSPDSDSDK